MYIFVILLFSTRKRVKEKNLKELLNFFSWKKFHNYGYKSIKN